MPLTPPTVAPPPVFPLPIWNRLAAQATEARQAASDIQYYSQVAKTGNTNPNYNTIASSAGFSSGGFSGAKGFAGAPPTTGGLSGSMNTNPEVPSKGDFAMLPIFAIAAVVLLFWLKRR